MLQNNFIEISLQHGCFPVNLLHIFRTPFYKNTYGRLLLQKAPPPSQIFDKIQNAPLLNIYNIYTYICYIYIYILYVIYMHYIYTYYINIHIYLGFLSGGINSNSFVPLPNASRILRHYPSDYCRKLTSAHSSWLDPNRVPLVSEPKLLTTQPCLQCVY